jgi:hypothetical protein
MMGFDARCVVAKAIAKGTVAMGLSRYVGIPLLAIASVAVALTLIAIKPARADAHVAGVYSVAGG